jgi:hypothetical protein
MRSTYIIDGIRYSATSLNQARIAHRIATRGGKKA